MEFNPIEFVQGDHQLIPQAVVEGAPSQIPQGSSSICLCIAPNKDKGLQRPLREEQCNPATNVVSLKVVGIQSRFLCHL